MWDLDNTVYRKCIMALSTKPPMFTALLLYSHHCSGHIRTHFQKGIRRVMLMPELSTKSHYNINSLWTFKTSKTHHFLLKSGLQKHHVSLTANLTWSSPRKVSNSTCSLLSHHWILPTINVAISMTNLTRWNMHFISRQLIYYLLTEWNEEVSKGQVYAPRLAASESAFKSINQS